MVSPQTPETPSQLSSVPRIPVPRTCPFAPPAEYGRLRDTAPVTRAQLPGGQEVWAVSTFTDVRSLLVRPDVSSDPRRPGFPEPFPDAPTEEPGATEGPADPEEEAPLPQLFEMDPPQHTRYRRMLIPELTVKRVNELRPGIQQLVDRLIDDMLATGPETDLVPAFALPIPSMVICQLLGVAYDSHEFFQSRTEIVLSKTVTAEQRETAYLELYAFLDEVVSATESDPTDDILGRLVVKYRRTDELSHEMLVNTAVLLLLAGHETSANTIALGVLTFLEHPGQLRILLTEPAAAVSAADEMVRFHSLGDVDISRVATADFTLGGQTIHAGEGILPILSAANRDPQAFERPDEFDIRRPDSRHHVGFGYGPHQCLGQNLARAELEIAYRTLFTRIPSLRLAVPVDELDFKTDSQIFGLRSLPVTW
ncbi:cytochrome P450 [Plantactinospora endophytica]|uniref:Cytochrome P450 n=1 Tax=Plantactinospora endophytica TaxID=673535 RepID=A0ABQ4EF04_9ACTN|nr:cytochrome P450 [Plantactinospora endophytica]GIG93244.1 cytochrome P450 [Plantactinospora endophytica]